MAPIPEKKLIPNEYFQSQKVTNAPSFISQSEPPAPKERNTNTKIRTNISVLSVVAGASVTPGNASQERKGL